MAIIKTINYIPVPKNTLINNGYDGGLNTSLLTYFHPISSKLFSSTLLGNLSNFKISLLIINLKNNATIPANNIVMANVKLKLNH